MDRLSSNSYKVSTTYFYIISNKLLLVRRSFVVRMLRITLCVRTVVQMRFMVYATAFGLFLPHVLIINHLFRPLNLLFRLLFKHNNLFRI